MEKRCYYHTQSMISAGRLIKKKKQKWRRKRRRRCEHNSNRIEPKSNKMNIFRFHQTINFNSVCAQKELIDIICVGEPVKHSLNEIKQPRKKIQN